MDRRLWTAEEDQNISRLVAKFGTKKWPLISERLCAETEFERTGKQCRQRWYNHLSPEISSEAWGEGDEERLFEAHKQFGNRWKVISKQFVGRTDNSIKNHFYSTIRRCLRRINKLQGEKNSTLKMRTIKPYVLSKILADRSLTETILHLGKIKPNKSRKDFKLQCLQEFNQMIAKLYDINHDYEQVKNNKKMLGEHKMWDPQPDPSERSEGSVEDQEEECKPVSPKKETKTAASLMISEQEEKGLDKHTGIKKPKRSGPVVRRRKAGKGGRADPQFGYKQFKQIKLPEPKDPFSSKRTRKSINYLKLNEGVLCDNGRNELAEETQQDSELIPRGKTEKQEYGMMAPQEKMAEIVEEAEREREREDGGDGGDGGDGEEREREDGGDGEGNNNSGGMFYQDENESKGLRHFQISQPSPSFIKNTNFFDDLVVIGTHMRILSTPKAERWMSERKSAEQQDRKQSEEDFIEQILEINFDPEFALKYGSESSP